MDYILFCAVFWRNCYLTIFIWGSWSTCPKFRWVFSGCCWSRSTYDAQLLPQQPRTLSHSFIIDTYPCQVPISRFSIISFSAAYSVWNDILLWVPNRPPNPRLASSSVSANTQLNIYIFSTLLYPYSVPDSISLTFILLHNQHLYPTNTPTIWIYLFIFAHSVIEILECRFNVAFLNKRYFSHSVIKLSGT